MGRFVPWDVLSLGRFVPKTLCLGTFCLGPFCPLGGFVKGRFVFSLQNKTIPSAGHGGTGFKKQTLVGIKKSYKRLKLAGMPGELGLTGTKL